MTSPQEKAIEIVNKFSKKTTGNWYLDDAKGFAVMCCDEIIDSVEHGILDRYALKEFQEYWKSVKDEIYKIVA